MNRDPFVDVIMPNYNKGEFLEESINSVISQEYKNWNLFVIDNFSNDNSKNILNKFRDKISNISIIYLSKNKGAAFSRNLGIRLSKAEYISFMDSDDYWSSNKLKDQINFMQKFKHIFTYSDYTPFILKNNNKVFKKEVISPNSFTYDQFKIGIFFNKLLKITSILFPIKDNDNQPIKVMIIIAINISTPGIS